MIAGEVRDAEAHHGPVEDGKGRGQEGQTSQDGDEDDGDAPYGDRLEDVVVDQEQRAERDHDRQAAEEDGSTRGGAGDLDCGDLVAAGPSFGAEARYDEERVVDGNRESDQDDDVRDVLADGRHRLAVDADQAHGADDRAQRQNDRHDSGYGRARRDQQDEERDDQRRDQQ